MKKTIITIGREFGSGGYEIGKRLAEELGWKFYDRELIAEIAEKNMISEAFVADADERPFTRNIFREIFPIIANDAEDQEKYIFNEQSKFIVNLAKEGNCVIIGRRSNYYLRNEPNALHIFLYADLDFRAERISREHNCTIEEAKEKIAATDKRRKASYESITGSTWGDMHSYDRLICTSSFGIDKAVEEILALVK